ncbi:PP2C family protein-serine/threonine phosphatase [Nocardiopsis algeriensis]|uniref:Serine phosphatase RsbU (Regulator of sigma subunit) n=1 Tax=Nocardiopsis algeriensis TaxID=1478215 RepID=A0A841IN31_9ACTN|nr:GAF domain-containing SpoIIE family protein phosphatase [Nocardiopsis algeriensis]MBB6120147.1 serine phosphatase RsbU (regulator of sigma subunit) [Nocardiopsis algeriensis]
MSASGADDVMSRDAHGWKVPPGQQANGPDDPHHGGEVAGAHSSAPHSHEEWTALLREAGRGLSSLLHPERLIEQAVRLPLGEVADLCILFTSDPSGRPKWTAAVADGTGKPEISRGRWSQRTAAKAVWLTEILDVGSAIAEPAPGDPVEGLVRTLARREGPVGSVRAVPVPGLTGAAGALLVYRHDGYFEESDTDLLTEYAEQVGGALGSAQLYQYQADTASTLKTALQPEPLPEIEHALLGASFRSAIAAERIGGDFYEVREAEAGGEGFDFSFGDVCGKGNDAALLSGMIRQSLQALRLVERDPVSLLEHLNILLTRTDPEKFSTVVLGTATPLPDGGLRILAAGGGHPAPLLVRSGGKVEEMSGLVGGMFVGAIEEAVFHSAETILAPGETMVVFSDGVTEARNPLRSGEMLGEERLRRLLEGCAGLPAPAVAGRIAQYVGDWLGGGEHDDITVLAVQAPSAQGMLG